MSYQEFSSILAPERTHHNLVAASKKKAIEEVSTRMVKALPMLDTEQVYESLTSREKLGSTAIGNGVAIPHCRLACCDGIVGGLFRLEQPVDFGAYDRQDVRLLFVLLVPTREVDEHLEVLAMLARRFESEPYITGLLQAKSDRELYEAALMTPVALAQGQ